MLDLTKSQLNAILSNLPKHQLYHYSKSGFSLDTWLTALLYTIPNQETLELMKDMERRKEAEDWYFDENGPLPSHFRIKPLGETVEEPVEDYLDEHDFVTESLGMDPFERFH
jgi:hypothetical protein